MKKIKEYLLCFVGALFVGIGVYFFKVPNNFSTGGVSGVSIILSGYFKLSSVGIIATVINTVMLVLGFIFVGKDCSIKTVLGTFTLSCSLIVFENLFPLSKPLTDEPLLELFFAVLFPAIGSAILFNCNGSTGGTDILAMILRKYSSLNIGIALLFTDFIITLGSFLFGAKTGLLAVLGLLMKSLIVDSVIENINLSKCFLIISEEYEDINNFIKTKLKRGCTIVEAKGGFTNDDTKVLISVMNRFQAVQLRRYLKENHPTSFVIVTNSSEIIGKGFRGF